MPREGEYIPQASRSMADITRLFMTGARPTPVRTPPGGARPVVIQAQPASVSVTPVPSRTIPLTLTVFLGTWPQALAAAASLAESRTLGVASLNGNQFKMARVGANVGGEAPAVLGSAPIEMQLARLLFIAKKSVAGWLLVVSPKDRSRIEQLLPVAEKWILSAGIENDELIETYRTLKALHDAAQPQNLTPAITLAFTGDLNESQRAFVRLSHVARNFLSQQLQFVFGRSQPGEHILADLPVQDADHAAAWASLFDFALDLSDQAREAEEESQNATEEELPEESLPKNINEILDTSLQNLLEPDERAALTAGLDEPLTPMNHNGVAAEEPKPQPVAQEPEHKIPVEYVAPRQVVPSENKPLTPVEKPVETVGNHPVEQFVPSSLLAVPMSHGVSGAAMWSALEPAVAALAAGHLILEARPPKQLASLLTVDRSGCLHVWMLADANDPTAYARIWQWAGEHRSLIALTRRDAALNTTADVRMHLILPAGMTLVHSGQDHFERLRMHTVRMGDQQGVVLVPVE